MFHMKPETRNGASIRMMQKIGMQLVRADAEKVEYEISRETFAIRQQHATL